MTQELIDMVVGIFHDGDCYGKDGWCERREEAIQAILDENDLVDENEAENMVDKIIQNERL